MVAALAGLGGMALTVGGSPLAGAQTQDPQGAERKNPTSLTYRATPRRDTKRPYKFTVRGRVRMPPPGLVCPPGQTSGYYCLPLARERACEEGRVSVRFKAGLRRQGNTISLRRVKTRISGPSSGPPFCAFVSRVTFGNPRRLGNGVLKVQVRWLGNDFYNAKSGPTKYVSVISARRERKLR